MNHGLIKTSAAVAAVSLLTLAGCSKKEEPAVAAPVVEQKAALGSFGIDLTARNEAVKPGDDFFDYANGQWMATTQIPADKSRWGTFDILNNKAEEQVREIIQNLPKDAAAGSLEQKIGDYYRTYLDTDAIEQAGLKPVEPGLKAIDEAATHADIARLMGDPSLNLASPINFGITVDEKNPDRYVVGIGQGGLSLPDRDYYLSAKPEHAEIRAKFLAHVERMLTLAGVEAKDAAAQSKAILDVQTKIAQIHWPRAKTRDRDLTYNLRTRAELDKMAGFSWTDALAVAGLDQQKEYVVSELSAVEGLAKQFKQIPVATWKSYLRYSYLSANASLLPAAFDNEAFDMYQKTLRGMPEQSERWKRSVNATGRALGEAVGQIYVQKHFPPESKTKMLELVENLRKAYVQRVQGLPWMTEETKKVALEKLASFRPKIGYPDKWRDYASLEVKAGDAFGNSKRASMFEYQRQLKRINEPTDRGEWFMTPQTINAYYNPTFNEIVFPAAILQPPFFDPNADDAVNYGAIGGVIGHEMGHGFDDQGAKSDAKGILRNWWKPEDEKSFKTLVDKLVVQYNAYETLPGVPVNGRLTLGENIGDLGGLTVAYEAYKISLAGKEAPVLENLTGDQRIFLSWAQCWRVMMREAFARNQVLTDTHSPPRFRVNGVVRNMDAWYAAFDVKPEDKLFLKSEDRVRIW